MREIENMPETILLVDEAQTKKADRFFWNYLLKVVVPSCGKTLKVGLFSSYGNAGAIPVELHSITPPLLPGSSRIRVAQTAFILFSTFLNLKPVSAGPDLQTLIYGWL
jgi:hypothetical protein